MGEKPDGQDDEEGEVDINDPKEIEKQKEIEEMFEKENWFRRQRKEELKAIGIDPETHFDLLPKLSFDIKNELYRQLDFPVSPNAIHYKRFRGKENEDKESPDYENRLMSFYAQVANRDLNVWSLLRITKINFVAEKMFEGILDYNTIKLRRGRDAKELIHNVSDADFPMMNPYDFIVMLDILVKQRADQAHLYVISNFLQFYLEEIAQTDCVLAKMLRVNIPRPNSGVAT